MNKKILKFGLVLSTLMAASCTPVRMVIDDNSIKDGNYDSEYSTTPTSPFIEKIMESVKIISSIAYYKYYEIPAEFKLTTPEISPAVINFQAEYKTNYNQPATGTATIVYFDGEQVALLTCAHTVDFPDTIYHYRAKEGHPDAALVGGVSVKARQLITVVGVSEANEYEIFAIDRESDIAIIGKKISNNDFRSFQKLNYKCGNADELNWGTLVYLAGCPVGKKMITTALVSKLPDKKQELFIIDSVLPAGSSGGLVFAVRDGMPNLELVGMVKSIAAKKINFISPSQLTEFPEQYQNNPYEGELYVQPFKDYYYGITYVISINKIVEFLEINRELLDKKGIPVSELFAEPAL